FCPRPADILALADDLGFGPPTTRAPPLQILPDSGLAIARMGPARLVAKVGEIGASYIPAHAHADALSFELWVGGQRLVVDTGVTQYAEGPRRDWCRSTAAHNTVTVDDLDSAEVWSSFRVGRRPLTTVRNTAVDPGEVRITASHDGYAHLPGSPLHERTWVLGDSSLRIHDRVNGSGKRSVVSRLRLDAEALRSLRAVVRSRGRPVRSIGGVWYPTNGVTRSAECFSAGGMVDLPSDTELELTWT
ncbi:MAG: heparinase II/III-family protein, partial [Myxococcales bacterium]|nr:heparinase II/III-family protein [Myxococcales bacterium]